METFFGQLAGFPLVFATCAVSGILLPVPEDVPVLIAGIAASAGEVGVVPAVSGAVAGVLVRDLALYTGGRLSGEALLRRPWVIRLVGQERIDSARALLCERGSRAVLAGRFFIGFRAPVFVTAGALGVPLRDFVLWDGLGLLVMVPTMFALGYAVGAPALVGLEWVIAHAWVAVVVAAVLAGIGWSAARWARRPAREP